MNGPVNYLRKYFCLDPGAIIKKFKIARKSKTTAIHNAILLHIQRNGSIMFDGHFNMETGEDDISQLGILRKWNYKDTTKFHKSPCNLVEGSAGEFWPPGRTKDDIILFSSDLCRLVKIIIRFTK